MTQPEVQDEPFSSDEEFDEEDDASGSSSDVDAKLAAEDDVFDVEFFKCYSALKKKDDKIYDKNVRFFNEEVSSESEKDGSGEGEKEGEQSNTKSLLNLNKCPKMTLLDYQLGLKEDQVEDEQHDKEYKVDLNKTVSKSFYEKELEEIKNSIERVGEAIDSDTDDDLLVVKSSDSKKSHSKPHKKINQILDKLEDEEDDDIKHLKQIWSDPNKLTDEEKYLRDYILNKRYIPDNLKGENDGDDEDDEAGGFFSRNLEDCSDADEAADSESAGARSKPNSSKHHSDEKDFEKIARIPRNSTKTIRDLVEKREKKEKRLKKVLKEKKKKKGLNDADCEDVVGDLPTRFHYRETEPNDFGLSAEELLMATDEELEKWVSLKDAIAYKSAEEELAQKRKFEHRRNNIELKKKVFKSIYGEPEAPLEAEKEGEQEGEQERSKSRKKRKRPKKNVDRLLSYGLSKTKLKKFKLL